MYIPDARPGGSRRSQLAAKDRTDRNDVRGRPTTFLFLLFFLFFFYLHLPLLVGVGAISFRFLCFVVCPHAFLLHVISFCQMHYSGPNDGLFFKHQCKEDDFTLRPEWVEQVKAKCSPDGGVTVGTVAALAGWELFENQIKTGRFQDFGKQAQDAQLSGKAKAVAKQGSSSESGVQTF